MNLLRDPWIPVRQNGGIGFISLETLLCTEGEWVIETHRDDLNLAALQLAICLTQVCLQPKDSKELRTRENAPLTKAAYLAATEPFVAWFNLCDPKYPFMQVAATDRADMKSLQKLLIGLPEVTAGSPSSNAFFNTPTEIRAVGLPMAAIIVFQQATNGVGLGGACFAKSLKGDAVLTALVHHRDLRRCVWHNTLSRSFLCSATRTESWPSEPSRPTWVSPISLQKGDGRAAARTPNTLEILRGLFWQPARILLHINPVNGFCDITRTESAAVVTGFYSEPRSFGYKGSTFWRHPHSPVRIGDGGALTHMKWPYGHAFWREFAGFFWPLVVADKGISPAWTVVQHAAVWHDEDITLMLGAYLADNQKITGRRHEMYALPAGWQSQMDNARLLLHEMVASAEAVGSAAYAFAKSAGANGWDKKTCGHFADRARSVFLARSEPVIHGVLQELSWQSLDATRNALTAELRCMAYAVFEELTAPYLHAPSALKGHVAGRRVLAKHLSQSATEAAA